jgi:hypothetical protein
MQAYANRINAEKVPLHDRNSRFSRLNWAWILLGSCVLLLSLAAMFLLPAAANAV